MLKQSQNTVAKKNIKFARLKKNARILKDKFREYPKISAQYISELELQGKNLEDDYEQSQDTVAIKNQEIARLEANAKKLKDDFERSETEKKLAKEDMDHCISK